MRKLNCLCLGEGGLPINMSVMRYRKVGSEIQSNLLKISREGNYSFQGPINQQHLHSLKPDISIRAMEKKLQQFLYLERVQTMTSEHINVLSISNEIPSTNPNTNTN